MPTTVKREKEIAVRKVLGADKANILFLLTISRMVFACIYLLFY